MEIGKKIMACTVFFLFIILFSCGKSDEDGIGTDELVGKWIVKRSHADIMVLMGNFGYNIDTVIDMPDDSNYMILYEDHTYSMKYDPSSFMDDMDMGMFKSGAASDVKVDIGDTDADTGTWSVSGTVLTLHSLIQDTSLSFPIILEDNTLTMTWDMDLDLGEELGMSVKGDVVIDFIR